MLKDKLSLRYVGVSDVGVWHVWGVNAKSLSYNRRWAVVEQSLFLSYPCGCGWGPMDGGALRKAALPSRWGWRFPPSFSATAAAVKEEGKRCKNASKRETQTENRQKGKSQKELQKTRPTLGKNPEKKNLLSVNGAYGVMQEDAREEGGRTEPTWRTCRVVAMVID